MKEGTNNEQSGEATSVFPFQVLPTELQLKVMQDLSAGDLARLGEVCKQLLITTNDPMLWRNLVLSKTADYCPLSQAQFPMKAPSKDELTTLFNRQKNEMDSLVAWHNKNVYAAPLFSEFNKTQNMEAESKTILLREKILDDLNVLLIQQSIDKSSTTLYLTYKITRLPQRVIEDSSLSTFWENLKYFDLSGSQLSVLPDNMNKLSRLTTLIIAFNKLTIFPNFINRLASLTSLDISSNNITELPDNVSNLINLSKLDISGNRIRSLPNSIVKLTNLHELNISHNEIRELDVLEHLHKLRSLQVAGNYLTSIPQNQQSALVKRIIDGGEWYMSTITVNEALNQQGIPLLELIDLVDSPQETSLLK